jgi:hypothetical protein
MLSEPLQVEGIEIVCCTQSREGSHHQQQKLLCSNKNCNWRCLAASSTDWSSVIQEQHSCSFEIFRPTRFFSILRVRYQLDEVRDGSSILSLLATQCQPRHLEKVHQSKDCIKVSNRHQRNFGAPKSGVGECVVGHIGTTAPLARESILLNHLNIVISDTLAGTAVLGTFKSVSLWQEVFLRISLKLDIVESI